MCAYMQSCLTFNVNVDKRLHGILEGHSTNKYHNKPVEYLILLRFTVPARPPYLITLFFRFLDFAM